MQLFQALSYKSLSDAHDFDVNNVEIVRNVFVKYDLKKYSKEDLTTIFQLGISSIPTYGSLERRTCANRLVSCNNGSWGVYILEMAGCVGLGVGIGTLTFWSAGAVGGIVWAACATGASMHMSSMLHSCQDAYDDCRG